MNVEGRSFVGESRDRTNFISSYLMDLGGNPYGTYCQEECCIHCGSALSPPPGRNLAQKLFTRAALSLTRAQRAFTKARPNWIHLLFAKGGQSVDGG